MKRYGLLLLAVVAVGSVAVLFAVRADKAPENATASATPKFEIDDSGKKSPWTGLTPNWSPEQFQFAVVADRTGGHRRGVFSKAVQQINLMHPEFVMSVGDLIEGGGTADNMRKQWDEFDGYAKQFKMPFFYCMGNHDAQSTVKQDVWVERLGKKYYHFAYKNCLFVIMNDMDYEADDPKDPPKQVRGLRVGKQQREYLEKALKQYPNAAHTFIFTHHPIWNEKDQEAAGWAACEAILKGRKHWVFCGHVHTYRKYLRNGTTYYQLATTGGSSALRGIEYGEFDQIGWVTMTKDGPTLANVSLDGILKDDLKPFVTEEAGGEAGRDAFPSVTGSVKVNGKPAAGWVVALSSIDDEEFVTTVSGRVKADGSFAIYGRRAVPVKAGKYFVTFEPAPSLIDDPAADKTLNPVPEKYRRLRTTPLTATVKDGGPNQFDFEVKE